MKLKKYKMNYLGKLFLKSFLAVEGLFIFLGLASGGFGGFGGFVVVSVFSLIVAFIVTFCAGALRRGAQIGEIIEAKHAEISKK
jgi:hypothetical protein